MSKQIQDLIDDIQTEVDETQAVDKADAPELSDEDNSYNEGWAQGMNRAIQILKEAID